MPTKKTNAPTLKPGTRVMFCHGNRLGTVERNGGRHGGYWVRFDEKAGPLENDLCRVYGRDLTPTDPALHAAWEAVWKTAPFLDRAWAKDAPARERY